MSYSVSVEKCRSYHLLCQVILQLRLIVLHYLTRSFRFNDCDTLKAVHALWSGRNIYFDVTLCALHSGYSFAIYESCLIYSDIHLGEKKHLLCSTTTFLPGNISNKEFLAYISLKVHLSISVHFLGSTSYF